MNETQTRDQVVRERLHRALLASVIATAWARALPEQWAALVAVVAFVHARGLSG